jgi:hypothetical protein
VRVWLKAIEKFALRAERKTVRAVTTLSGGGDVAPQRAGAAREWLHRSEELTRMGAEIRSSAKGSAADLELKKEVKLQCLPVGSKRSPKARAGPASVDVGALSAQMRKL